MAEEDEMSDKIDLQWRVLLDDLVDGMERFSAASAAAREAEEDIFRMVRYARRTLNENKPKEP